jgi:autotransporter-associated beta strand protein
MKMIEPGEIALRDARGKKMLSFLAIAALGLPIIIGSQPMARGDTVTWAPADGSTAWDDSTDNWTGDSSTYSDSDTAVFADPVPPGGGTVVIGVGGVNPGEVDVTNNSGIYNISGGPIGGGGAVLMTGSGTLILGSSNSYSGGTTISAGTLEIEAGDSSLGASTGTVTFENGGTLSVVQMALNSVRNFFVGSGGGFINTGGYESSTSGTVSGPGILTKEGAGDFTISGQIGSSTQSSEVSVEGGSLTIAVSGTDYVNVDGSGNATVNITGNAPPTGVGGPGAAEIESNIALTNCSANYEATQLSELIISGTITGNGTVTFAAGNRNDTALIELNTPAGYTGNTYLNIGYNSVLRLGAEDALPDTGLSFGYYSGALDLNGYDLTISSLTDNGFENGITNTGSTPSTLTIDQDSDTTFGGNIGTLHTGVNGTFVAGLNANPTNIDLVKDGAGTLQLTGSQNYSGSTKVNGGTLIVNGGSYSTTITGGTLVVTGGITNTSGVTVASGATLAGVGAIGVAQGGQVVIGNGATISPGDPTQAISTGILLITSTGTPSNAGTFDLEQGGTLSISLQAYVPGGSQASNNFYGSYDSYLQVDGGSICINGNLSVELLAGFTANLNDLFFIILNGSENPILGNGFSNAPTNGSTVIFDGPGGETEFAVYYDGNVATDSYGAGEGNDVVLQVVGVPEPGSGEICLAGFALLVIIQGIRRNR